MTSKNSGTLPLPRPGKYLRQLFDALRGHNTDQIRHGDGVLLPDMQVALLRDSPHNHSYHLVIADGETLYQVATIPVHAVQHLQMQRFGPAPKKEAPRPAFGLRRVTQEALRRMGYNPINRGGDGRRAET